MANNLKSLREGKGWTQPKAAAAFGLSLGGYTKMEYETRRLKDARIKQAMKIYGVSASAVIGAGTPFMLAGGRRLENIRRALAPNLPSQIGLSSTDWTELLKQGDVAIDLAVKIQKVTSLPSGYITYGDPTGIERATLARLLAFALDDFFGSLSDDEYPETQTPASLVAPMSKRAKRRAPSAATSKRPSRRPDATPHR